MKYLENIGCYLRCSLARSSLENKSLVNQRVEERIDLFVGKNLKKKLDNFNFISIKYSKNTSRKRPSFQLSLKSQAQRLTCLDLIFYFLHKKLNNFTQEKIISNDGFENKMLQFI